MHKLRGARKERCNPQVVTGSFSTTRRCITTIPRFFARLGALVHSQEVGWTDYFVPGRQLKAAQVLGGDWAAKHESPQCPKNKKLFI